MGRGAPTPGAQAWRSGAALVGFLVLATLNSAGYRYGASDQAFYGPVVMKAAHPDWFPRDADLIHSQARLTYFDNISAVILNATGMALPVLFALLYVLALGLLALAASQIGGVVYRTRWATLAFLAAIALRHAILRSGTNTLEGYFHPRQLAFALGALAIAAFLRRSAWTPVALVGCAGLLHPTTALWFAVWLGVAVLVAEPKLRIFGLVAGCASAIIATWTLTAGPLAGRLSPMDAEWIATLAGKDYLFPLDWPLSAWVINLAYVPTLVWLFRQRRTAGIATAQDRGLLAGCLVLFGVFLMAVPLNAMRVQLAIQLQPARIFWMLDFLAVCWAVWILADGARPVALSAERSRPGSRRARTVAAIVVILAVARGAYVTFVEFPTRPVAALDFPEDDWGRVMRWGRRTAVDSHWLAHPNHAVLYGTSVRVAAYRDLFVEPVKDEALGMYERDVAIRTRDRIAALGDFERLTPERLRQLAATYDLDYVVTEQALDLPVAFSSGALRVYELHDRR